MATLPPPPPHPSAGVARGRAQSRFDILQGLLQVFMMSKTKANRNHTYALCGLTEVCPPPGAPYGATQIGSATGKATGNVSRSGSGQVLETSCMKPRQPVNEHLLAPPSTTTAPP